MKLRAMTIDDYDDVYAIWSEMPGVGLGDSEDSREGIQVFLEKNAKLCFVAEDGERVIGCVLCGSDGRRATFYHLAVRRDARRKGIGRALVDTCMNALREEGIRKARLYAFASNVDGNAFWEAVGFTGRDDLVLRNRVVN